MRGCARSHVGSGVYRGRDDQGGECYREEPEEKKCVGRQGRRLFVGHFFRLWLIELVGVNGFVMFCYEEFVYFFVADGAEVFVELAWVEFLFLRAGEAIYVHCFFEEIAGGHQHYDDGDEKEEGYTFNHGKCVNRTKLDL
jgi:hypothetical protein